MRTIPLSEALILGATSQPLCHGAFMDGKRVCLLTAAVRACGRKPATSHEVVRDCIELWPWLVEVQACPAVTKTGNVAVALSEPHTDKFIDEVPVLQSPALCWIINHFDCGWRVEWIADQIRLLEDHVAHMAAAGKLFEAARERRNPKPEGGSPHDSASSADGSRAGAVPRHRGSVYEAAVALGRLAGSTQN